MRWRDLEAGKLRKEHVGQRFALAGWAARRRDHGGLVFIDLRDESGLAQLVINPERAADAAKVAHDIRNEFVIRAEGEVVARAPEAVNPSLPTGEVELQVDELEIVSRSEPLPFQLDDENVEETRGCATATSTCGARRCRATCASPPRSSPRSGASWTSRASSTSGRRT